MQLCGACPVASSRIPLKLLSTTDWPREAIAVSRGELTEIPSLFLHLVIRFDHRSSSSLIVHWEINRPTKKNINLSEMGFVPNFLGANGMRLINRAIVASLLDFIVVALSGMCIICLLEKVIVYRYSI